MAGDWIKMRTDLYRDPKVIVMANLLGQKDSHLARHVNQFMQRDMSVTSNVTRCAVVGALVAVWGVARHQGHRDGDDLIIKGVNSILLDDLSELPGFGDVMTEVGWAVDTDAGLLFPKFFAENNVDPEDQKREQAALRKRRQREREQRDNERDAVRDKSVTVTHREEKSREELSLPIGRDTAPAKKSHEETQPDSLSEGVPESITAHQVVIQEFNAVAPVRCTHLTDKRRKAMAQRLRDRSWNWRAALDRIPDSDFLSGRAGNWKGCTIDFFLRPDTVTRILEGAFDNGSPRTTNQNGRAISDQFGDYAPAKPATESEVPF